MCTNLHVTACKSDIGGVLGVKDSMIAHILGKNGSNPCQNASEDAQNAAKAQKKGKKKRDREDNESESENGAEKKQAKSRKLLTNIESTLKQPQLKVFRGIQVPFTEEQEKIVHAQFLRATISANLPFRWVEDVILLFLLFQSTASAVIPSRQQISGQLLDNADAAVSTQLKTMLRGQYAVLASDGWKDESRDSVNGVNLSVNRKVTSSFGI